MINIYIIIDINNLYYDIIRKMNGYLEIAIGPMFASKTSWLIQLYNQYTVYTTKIIVVNYIDDKRYGENSVTMCTHNHITIPCLNTKKLYDLNILDDEIDIILVNEGQFFPDLVEWTKEMVDTRGKKVYICGLDGDYKREKFGDILQLIPLCDKVSKLTALCGSCKNGTKAIFTKRITNSKEQVLIGEKEHYLPVCRKCFI
jgi:thymidine kinase